MRVHKGFNARIDSMNQGSKRIRLGEGITVGVLVFTLTGGEREARVTNPDEGEMADSTFPERYYKRWPIETKYCRIKQKMELENFSGRLVDNMRQDFYAMMTVSTMLASCLREANGKISREQAQKENRYEYQANVNHAVGY